MEQQTQSGDVEIHIDEPGNDMEVAGPDVFVAGHYSSSVIPCKVRVTLTQGTSTMPAYDTGKFMTSTPWDRTVTDVAPGEYYVRAYLYDPADDSVLLADAGPVRVTVVEESESAGDAEAA